MNLYIRLLIVIIRSFFKPRISDVLDGCQLSFIVLPNDLDTNVHMNNGRYLTIMDLGRMDLVLRTGLLDTMMKNKYMPVLSGSKMRYRIPLMPFQAYKLKTRLICWDDKWAYMEQRFEISKGPKKGATAAIGLLKAGFYDRVNKKTVPTSDLLEALELDANSPEFPVYINKWLEAEENLKQQTADERKKAAQ